MSLEDVPPPEPGPGQVLVDVDAVGLNFPDLLQLRGGYQVKPELPYTPGTEIAGTVRQLGAGVTTTKVGDRVLAMGGSGLAEQTVVNADGLYAIADDMDSAKAACLPTNYGTSLFALRDRARLQAGETVLVHAGAGGVGSAAVQLAKAMGATVYATAGGPEKKQVLVDLGVDAAIDYLAEDFVDVVKGLTGGRGVDVIYDPVGGDTFDRSRKVIGWDGRLLIIGFTSGRIADAPTNNILLKNYSVVGVHYGASIARDRGSIRRHLDDLSAMFAAGSIDPLIMRHVALDDAPGALEALGNRQTYGKLVVVPLLVETRSVS